MAEVPVKALTPGDIKLTGAPVKTNSTPVEIDSSLLFENRNELFIRHDGERYTLRRTSKGKLILTK